MFLETFSKGAAEEGRKIPKGFDQKLAEKIGYSQTPVWSQSKWKHTSGDNSNQAWEAKWLTWGQLPRHSKPKGAIILDTKNWCQADPGAMQSKLPKVWKVNLGKIYTDMLIKPS